MNEILLWINKLFLLLYSDKIR